MATVTILDKNAPPSKATVNLDAASYELNNGSSTMLTVQRTNGSGAVWVQVTMTPIIEGNPGNHAYYSCMLNTYSGKPGENVSIELRAHSYMSPDDGLVIFVPYGQSKPNGDKLYNVSLTVLDDTMAATGVPSHALVTVHPKTTVTSFTLNASHKIGSLSISGPPENPEINMLDTGAGQDARASDPGADEGPGNPAADVHLNPQPEPPRPTGLVDGIVNSVKNIFGLK